MFRQELRKVASANADRWMKAEEKDAQGLTGNIGELGKTTMQSIEKLRIASLWMKYLPNGDKPAKDRAELRGDTIMKRPDPTFTQSHAMMYYEFSGSPKATGCSSGMVSAAVPIAGPPLEKEPGMCMDRKT